jgi:beta-galactosidase
VYFANNEIRFEVTGPAKIRAVDSGDLANGEPFQSDHRRADHGRCLLILQSSGEAGTVHVRASAEGLEVGELTMPAGK